MGPHHTLRTLFQPCKYRFPSIESSPRYDKQSKLTYITIVPRTQPVTPKQSFTNLFQEAHNRRWTRVFEEPLVTPVTRRRTVPARRLYIALPFPLFVNILSLPHELTQPRNSDPGLGVGSGTPLTRARSEGSTSQDLVCRRSHMGHTSPPSSSPGTPQPQPLNQQSLITDLPFRIGSASLATSNQEESNH